MNFDKILFGVCIVLLLFTLSGNKENKETYGLLTTNTVIGSVEEEIEMMPEGIIVFGFVCVAWFASKIFVVYADFIKRVREDIFTKVIHESFKNVKQYPRGTIDNRTNVLYNNTIAILVRAVNGGEINGRIQKINNRHG